VIRLEGQLPEEAWDMRSPCSYCGGTDGRLEVRGGQNCVFCVGCGQWCYNAPKAETGEAVRSLASRPEIKPSQRTRVFSRDGYACLCCHATDRTLVVGHLISVAQGHELGMSDSELFADENLAAFCEECNAGQGAKSVSPRLIWRSQQAARL
jgi:hypothetical protein